jgi:hypothetical protein
MRFNFRDILRPKETPSPQQAQIQSKLEQALAFHQRGQLPQAKALYTDILKAQPTHANALHLLGGIASQTGEPQTAVELFDKAIASKPNFAEAHFNRGNALQVLRQLDAALASYDEAVAIRPDYAEAHANRGAALQALKHLDDAVAGYDRAISIKPDHAEAYSNRGAALHELKQLDAAVASFDKAIAIKPDYAVAYFNRGIVLQELKQPDAAVASFDEAIAIKPDYAEAHSVRGLALHALNQLDAAVASFDEAIAIKPDYADANFNKGLALLSSGNFEKGWELYEWRWKMPALKGKQRNFTQPQWLGTRSIEGRTVLLHAEQGFGDTIQFCRYARLVANLGAKVIVEVPAALKGLLQGLGGASEIVEAGQALPAFDFHCPLMSLPLAFKTTLNTIPAPGRYLLCDRGKTEFWANKLGAKARPRVGLVWSGTTTHVNDHNRTLTLGSLLPHLPATFDYVSLQKELRDGDKAALASSTIRHFGEELREFSDTAALCELMDVVISVDTSVAHLAGALGKRTWVLLPYVPDWRWLLDRDDSPWYPSAKLYRQERIGEWAGVLERVGADLAALGRP